MHKMTMNSRENLYKMIKRKKTFDIHRKTGYNY